MTTKIVNPELSQTLVQILNNADTQIKVSWISVDTQLRHATIEIYWALKGKSKFNMIVVEAFINPNLWAWLTKRHNIKVGDTTETKFQTGFERYLDKLNKKKCLITDLEFGPVPNNSESYSSNPFHITCNKDGIWSIRLVNSVSKVKEAYIDPSTGEEKVYYKTKRTSDGKRMFLAPQFYRRISIQ